MAAITIDGLPAADPLDGTEPIPCVQAGVTVKTTTQAVADMVYAQLPSFPYIPAAPANWAGSPATVGSALDRLAAAVAGLLGGPIP